MEELLTSQEKRKIAKERLRDRVIKAQDRLISAQMSVALGTQWLYRIDIRDDGTRSKPVLVTDELEIQNYLSNMYDQALSEYYFIATDKPDIRAIDSLLDRALGKPSTVDEVPEQTEDIGVIMYPTAEELTNETETLKLETTVTDTSDG